MINRDRAVQTFIDLARIDSPSGQEDDVARWTIARLQALGFAVQEDTFGNLVARQEHSGHSPLVLSAHMDTVQPCIGIQPRIEGDLIVSDGTTIVGGDCKAGITAILEALASLQEDGVSNVPVEVFFSRQEEMGLVGAKNLDFPLLTGKQAIIFDTNGPVETVVSGAPTHYAFNVEVTGRAAHAGAEPEKGLSAILLASEIITRLPQGRVDAETTANVGLIEGGSVRNSVPARAAFKGEFRSRNPETLAKVKSMIEESVAEVRGLHTSATIEIEFVKEFDGYNLTGDEPLLAKVTSALGSIGLEPQLGPTGGGTDANILRQHGIESLVVGMACREIHTVKEVVDITWLVNAARFCETMITNHES
jgi:tripeptide aminopeptidase